MIKQLLPLTIAAVFCMGSANAGDISEGVKKAMKSDIRTAKEVKRDRNRRPVQTLEFFGIKDDMKVLELIPGGGWYTKLLAPALRDNGKYYAAIGTDRVKKNLIGKSGFDKVTIINPEANMKYNSELRDFEIENLNLGSNDFDAILTFRNYHNFVESARHDMNKAAFKALKSGGIYGVVDHTRRHMQRENDENGRRFDPVLAIKEIEAAGFKFVDYSNIHYKADDELRYEVGRKTVTGNTDRFTLLFKKM
ncbi:MAG: methyltransferase [Gammaproteobacteria bacterium MedPE]|nr:MAG: methyltransferase [Gammaproteobacteria bacterium MedPE]